MTMRYIFLILVLFCFKGFGQVAQNLIPNGSFEQHYNCNYSNVQWVYPFDSVVVDWVDAYELSADYFNTCNLDSDYATPINVEGYQKAKEGNAYVGITSYTRNLNITQNNIFREFIQCKLINKLTIGKKYSFTMYVNLADRLQTSGGLGDPILLACNNLGAYFTTWQYLLGATSLTFPTTHQINFKQIVTDTSNWVELKQSFIADSAYEFITIGNLNPYDSTKIDTVLMPTMVGSDPNAFAYYFIDDVSLVEDTSSMVNNIEKGASRLYVYPNPVLNQLTVSNNNYSINSIEVSNVLGQQQNVSVEKLTTENCLLKTSNLPSGIYFIKATDSKGNIMNGKFVKE
jgi:hypothetical protein